MGYSCYNKNNKTASFHDSDFYQNGKFIKGEVSLFAKIPFLGDEYFILCKKPIKVKYRHSGYCADEGKFSRRVRKILTNFKINDIHGFTLCKNEKDILDKLIQILSKSKNPKANFWIEAIKKKSEIYDAYYYMQVLTCYF